MKRSENFLLRDVAGTLVIVPVGAAVSAFPGMITLNDTAAYLWELLEQEQTEDSLVQALCGQYAVDTDTARKDIVVFLEKLRSVGALTEE